VHNFGSTPCCDNAQQGCNYWNYNWGVAGSIQNILIHFGNIYNYGVGSFLSIFDIQNNINQQRPFIIRWGWVSGGGHFIVGHGIQDNIIYYMDPWFGEGFKVSTYDNLKNSNWHVWTHTNVLSVSPTYTVTFAGENISIAPQTIEYGGYVVEPPYPERENYTFDGWFTDNNTFINEWNFETDVVTQDLTLYAKWVEIVYHIVTFEGEETDIEPQTVEHGNYITKPPDPEREDYNFRGWFIDNGNFANEWNFEINVVTQDTTLYAKWEVKTGIAKVESTYIIIYPNPVNDELIIETGELKFNHVEIVDSSGKTIYWFDNSRNKINVSDLTQGIYFVRIKTDKENLIYKFVKE